MARPKQDLNFTPVCVIPNEFSQRFAYNGDGTVSYAGHAAKGSSESESVWTVQEFTYVSQQVTEIKIGYGSWANRASLTYE